MKLIRRDFLYSAGAAIAATLAPPFAWGEAYPARSVRVVVPFAPGGVGDVTARLVVQKLSDRLGKQFYVENIGGAGGNIGTGQAAKAAADGYTLLCTAPAFVINPALYEKLPYSADKDFAPVTLACTTPVVLTVNPELPVQTVKELVALIKANPGKYNYASAGVGTPPHLVGELFRLSLGLDLVHIPYNSGGQSVGSTIAGHTPIAFGALGPAASQVKAGKLRALAVASQRRSQLLPDVPTMAEAGYPDIEGQVWTGILAPVGTPKEIITLLHREIVKSLALPDVNEKLSALGYVSVGSTPEEFGAQIKSELTKWSKVVREAGIKAS
jgi:tripartite-type tricarboxylate transporter receptor subunit TctC